MTGGVWPAIGAIAATIYTVAFVVSISLLVRQLRVQSLSEAYDRLQTEDVRSARRAIYEIEEQAVSFEDWRVDSNSVAAAEKICQTYDYFAQLVRHDALPGKLVLPGWAWQVERLWRNVRPLVQEYRKRPGQGHLWEDFQWLALKSSKWLARRDSMKILPTD